MLGINAECHQTLERRNNPDPRDQCMLGRIDMDGINMPREIILVANAVLPIASLPDAAFAFDGAAVRMRSQVGRLREMADLVRRERAAKYASAARSVRTVWRRSGSNHTIDRERMRPPRRAKYAAQASICCVSKRSPSFARLSVKKKLPTARNLRRIRSCRNDPMAVRRQYGAVAFPAGPEAEPSVLLDQVMG